MEPQNNNGISFSEEEGLSDEEVKQRKERGESNDLSLRMSKSNGRILAENFFPFFNIVLYGVAILFFIFEMVLSKQHREELIKTYFGISKYGFLLPLLLNSLIGSLQEIHARNVLSKLKIVTENKVRVLRSGKEVVLPVHELVKDDILFLKPGDQVPVDLLILEGKVRVDESLLSGESTPISKGEGKKLLAGSFILSGHIKGRAIAVGKETYLSSIEKKVVSLSNHKSQLMTDIYRILNVLSVLLFVMLFLVIGTLAVKVTLYGNESSVFDGMTMSLSDAGTWGRIVLTAGAFTIGIIPTGLVLITSLTLSLSILRLSKEKTLIQGLYSLENLARVDTLCLDKTGTLTDGKLEVESFCSFIPNRLFRSYLASFNSLLPQDNATSEALLSYFGKEEKVEAKEIYPFSSDKKYSGYLSKDSHKVLLGAPEFLFKEGDERLSYGKEKAKAGYRILALSVDGSLCGFILLRDHIRDSAKATIEEFYQNHVDIKILSGDSPLTVQSIARSCGVKNADSVLSCEGLSDEELASKASSYTCFARLLPEQKQVLVEALQKKGHKVAMTGDGINDILALRKADCSISFLSGSDAAKALADVVLLDNDFSHLKEVVKQGRRVINNIERTAVLFLSKTFALLLLAFLLIPFKKGQLWYSVENVYLLQTSIIAFGGFLLSLESTDRPLQGSFNRNVLSKAFSASLLIFLGAYLPILISTISSLCGTPLFNAPNTRSLISLGTFFGGFIVFLSLSKPFTPYRRKCAFLVFFIALLCCLASPRSYVGGAPTNLSHFHDGSSFFTSTYMREFFQPWNSPVYQNLFRQYGTLIYLGIFFAVSLPLYLLLSPCIEKGLEHLLSLKRKKVN